MPLAIGTQLGSHEITALLGKGGMGEVYRARDLKLKREVAIKILPEEFSRDADRVSRFQREAEVLASLNHPNIAGIYDFEEANDTRFLVLELVEGETLADRIARGPIPVEDALHIAKGICDALEAAHEKGIVHRDLKPANIKLTKDGAVKVLDFGLARMREAEVAATNISNSPTLMSVSSPGMIMGTAAYMSPEQTRGKDVDKRADIWAFGVVLYEMLTGQPLFQGETVSDTLAAVLKEEPVWHRVPEKVQRLLRSCLERDPKRRLRDIGDAWRQLEERPLPVTNRLQSWLGWGLASLSVATVLAAALFFAIARSPVPSTDAVRRFNIYAPEKTVFLGPTYGTVSVPQFALSPDGRTIAFVAGAPNGRSMLWVKSMEELSGRPLTGTDEGEAPFWSPDNHLIGFFAQGELKTVPAAGGPVREVAKATDPRGGSWSPNGTIVFGTGNGGVFRVLDAGGEPVEIRKLDTSLQEGSHRWPSFLPDGSHFIVNIRSGLANHRGVYVGSLDGSTPKFLTSTDASALYANGYLLSLNGNTLLAQRFDEQRLELSGPTFVVAEGVTRSSTAQVAVSASRGGVLAYSSALLSLPGQLTWVDQDGTLRSTVTPEGFYPDFRFSHDEKRLAASRLDPKTGNVDIYMTDLAQENRTQQFTFGPLINASPLWSHDDTLIAFRTTRSGGFLDFYQKSSAGGGKEEPLLLKDAAIAAGSNSTSLLATDWSSEYLLYASYASVGSQLWLLPMAGERRPTLFRDSPSEILHANFSPSGRLLAYTSNESGKYEVLVETVPRSDKKLQISIRGGYEPRWKADGSEIYFLSADRKFMAVKVEANFSFSSPKVLFQTRVAEDVHAYHMHYLPSRDGRFLMNIQAGDPVSTPITIVLNWVQGLKK
jgi:serine/threonine protein kinase/Tol biopolymer transport system component